MDRFVPLRDGPPEEGDREDEAPGVPRPQQVGAAEGADGQAPDLLVEQREFASALIDCAGALESRSRTVWFFRTFLGMRSREIATHPSVGARTEHVDVLFSRSRKSISECMKRKGHTFDTVPPGILLEVWDRFREAGGAPRLPSGLGGADDTGPGEISSGDAP